MIDYDRIRAVKKDAQARLRSIPGVHAVGIGAKVVGGQRTTEPAIIVFVVRKKAPSEIPPEEMVPAEIDGVKTDIIEAAIPRMQMALPDTGSYRDSGLQGGIQIQVGGVNFGGTLGCIGATDEPVPKIVAITNHHVVAPQSAQPSLSTLAVSVSADSLTITFSGASTPNLQVAVDIGVPPSGGHPTRVPAEYVTVAGDSLANIALQVAALINANANPSVTANVAGAQITLAPSPGTVLTTSAVINRLFGVVDGPGLNVTFMGTADPGLLLLLRIASRTEVNGPISVSEIYRISTPSDTLASIATGMAAEINSPVLSGVPFTATANGAQVTLTPVLNTAVRIVTCQTYAARTPQPTADLKTDVTNARITLRGRVSGDNYGVFTNVNVGGFEPSQGIFVAPHKDMDLNDLAVSIAAGLTNLKIPNVSFTAPGVAQIEITGAEEVECLITSDIRVGQPDNNFPSACLDCSNSRIGRVLDARLDLDCAIIQLDPGMKYKNEVAEIGVVSSFHIVTPDEATTHTYQVEKRGRTTGFTQGTVQAIDVDGIISNASNTFQRNYAGVMQIHSTTANPFSGEGDSGSAILNTAHEVVGLLFGSSGGDTVATPIFPIMDAMQVMVQTATVPGNVLTVPKPSAPHAISAISLAPAPPPGAEPLLRRRVRERMREMQSGVAATPAARRYSTLAGFFAPEIRWLIDTNRRVAATWQRCGGAQLVQAMLAILQQREGTMPVEIEGRPLAACVARIQEVLSRSASPGLAAVLRDHAPRIARLGGLNYNQMLAALESPRMES